MALSYFLFFLVTRFGGTFGRHIFEYCFQYILNNERNYTLIQSLQKESKWGQNEYPSKLS